MLCSHRFIYQFSCLLSDGGCLREPLPTVIGAHETQGTEPPRAREAGVPGRGRRCLALSRR